MTEKQASESDLKWQFVLALGVYFYLFIYFSREIFMRSNHVTIINQSKILFFRVQSNNMAAETCVELCCIHFEATSSEKAVLLFKLTNEHKESE